MKQLSTFIMLFALATISAQDFQVQEGYKFEKDEDYAKYNKDIIDCVNWLEDTRSDEKLGKRQEATKFFIEWLTGTPDITVDLLPEIITFNESSPDLLVTYMGGWTKFVLQNPGSANDKVKATTAGLKSVIKVYKSGKGANDDTNVDKIAAIDNKGELEKWVAGQLKK